MIDLNEVACRDAVKSFKRLLTFLDGEPTKEQLGKITATLRAANYALDLNGDDIRTVQVVTRRINTLVDEFQTGA